MSNPYIGEIRMVGFSFAPPGWLACNGQVVSISDYEALFNLIGTIYGGDGVNNFELPNLQSRVALHQGTDSFGNGYTLGALGGAENVTLSANTLGSHTHPFTASSAAATTSSPSGAYPATGANRLYVSDPANNVAAFAANAILPAGGSAPHNNIMPYQCISFIIAVEGVYPPQS